MMNYIFVYYFKKSSIKAGVQWQTNGHLAQVESNEVTTISGTLTVDSEWWRTLCGNPCGQSSIRVTQSTRRVSTTSIRVS
jgi:hypothetical protein